MRRAGFAALICFTSAAHAEWRPMGYQGFVESIDALAGPNAVDCGFLDLLDKGLSRTAKSRAYQCVRSAIKSGQPFKFGTLRLPIDSYYYQVLVRSSRGEIWQITYDRMIDDSDQQQWNQVCRSVSVNRKLFFTGDDCVSQPDGRLKP